ncbi:MAG: alpha-glucan family phosphorylase [Acidobacteriota bacterium]
MDWTPRFPDIPQRIGGIEKLAYNLWWSWNPDARALFWALDLAVWRESGHNPIRMLAILPGERLREASEEATFLRRYDAVMARFEAETAGREGWFTRRYGSPRAPLAYFSAEYGLHVSLPMYAGGLGILAGDYLKECSDMAIPVVAVGLLYSRGYVTQRIREDGSPEDLRETLDRTYDPVRRVLDGEGRPLAVQVPLFDPPLHVAVWKVEVGRVPLYLMDTDLETNQPWDRAIAHHLYAIQPEQRLRQEIVLGMGGMRVLEALGLSPGAVHINEGHPALALLQRVRPLMEQGMGFTEALEEVRRTTVFTTHTPVSAGTDVFPFAMMEKYFAHCCQDLGLDHTQFLGLGTHPQQPEAGFNTTAFALRMSRFANGVSRRHGEVAREIWAPLWPERPTAEVPIAAVTNGVHLPTWMDPHRLQPLFDRVLGPDWRERQDDPGLWDKVEEIPDEELWRLHQELKVRLIDHIHKRARPRWERRQVSAQNVIASGALLDAKVLTLGFARRFTAYKRPDLLLRDRDRLMRLVTDPLRPVQIIFAGKAHPADTEGKHLVQEIFRLCQDPEFAGRLAFVEDYDQALASYLVRGVDVWLNNPVPPLEASGTSGMKAGMNGTLNCSILDGWWIEGFSGKNGWSFGEESSGEEDRFSADAQALFRLLEEQVVPLYYAYNGGIPKGWVRRMKESIRTVAPHFGTRRMVREYVEQFYVAALGLHENGAGS